ncbi:hypothetical protein H072_8276 [Dactylellina haptotyla CBS 200.50]|uniref:Manganese lipoxygenase n=1 Tax=Dactylellina haptotyla (strain CBS 200.50) TaxID=1284197 RepID=S8AA97_DACHA|nr:hypothetical protein H072_8276 [Dactylellina haptotyla CBS 200.50]
MSASLPVGPGGTTPGFDVTLPVPPSPRAAIDPGVFGNRLRSLGLGISPKNIPKKGQLHAPSFIGKPEKPSPILIEEASFEDTAIRLKLMYQQVITKFGALHDFLNFDSSVTTNFDVDYKRKLYQWSTAEPNPVNDGFPPHLKTIPVKDQNDDIFHESYLFYAQLAEMLLGVIPAQIKIGDAPWRHWGTQTLADLQQLNVNLINDKKAIWTEKNIGYREDWYSDEQFAQQHFTGPNPTTISWASDKWIGSFKEAAKRLGTTDQVNHLNGVPKDSLYIQDYSYFRKAAGVEYDEELASTENQYRFGKRYTGASVVLFQLCDDGKLHPLAIVVDYKENDIELDAETWYYNKTTVNDMGNSVVMFNQRLSPEDKRHNEAKDYPWRYAKMCAQVCDWHRHEVGIHLVHTHLIEEAVIVAAERSFENLHPVYLLLNPHWLKTLSLNQAAREALVPKIIKNIAGMDETQLSKYLNNEYGTFHWEDLYIPKDLERRGFPLNKLNDDKYRNYPYAKNMAAMWYSIRQFVNTILTDYYEDDNAVADDEAIKSWVSEMQDQKGGALRFFPNIATIDQLVDAVTMCIHIASPQHTAVNYLQEYYQVFVPNKPSSLATPLPNQDKLAHIKEQDIIAALPLDKGCVWLLSAYIPHLLSMLVSDDQNIISYAKTELDYRQSVGDEAGIAAATKFQKDLGDLQDEFEKNSRAMNVDVDIWGGGNYSVMDPRTMAVSILI